MSGLGKRNLCVGAVGVILLAAELVPSGSALHAGDLDLRQISTEPEPLSQLHAKLCWMTQQKVRAIWIGPELFEKFKAGYNTNAQLLADAGFNLVCVSMSVNSDNNRSGVVDTS